MRASNPRCRQAVVGRMRGRNQGSHPCLRLMLTRQTLHDAALHFVYPSPATLLYSLAKLPTSSRCRLPMTTSTIKFLGPVYDVVRKAGFLMGRAPNPSSNGDSCHAWKFFCAKASHRKCRLEAGRSPAT